MTKIMTIVMVMTIVVTLDDVHCGGDGGDDKRVVAMVCWQF